MIRTASSQIRRAGTAAIMLALAASAAHAVRIKDIASIQGVRDNQLTGMGLVVGLAGTGDENSFKGTQQAVSSYLRRNGIVVDPSDAESENSALVLVTATLPPFAKQGARIDVAVSALGDAKSLQGGILLQCPLRAATGDVYAVAQGPLILGGFAASAGGGGNSVTQNHPTVGLIPNGALIEREVPFSLQNQSSITYVLANPDHTTAARMAETINARFGGIAMAKDFASVEVRLPQGASGSNMVKFISDVESLPINPDVKARVVINERTGTVVIGEDVRISTVAIAKGNLTIETTSVMEVSQPQPFSQGVTTVVEQTGVAATETESSIGSVHMLEEGVSIGEVVRALNAVGATPRDLIAILHAIKDAGALQAELIVQ